MAFRYCIILVSCLLTGCLTPLVHDTRNLEVPHFSGKPLIVESANGKISVHEKAGDRVAIVATVKAQSTERLEKTNVLVERNEVEQLVIRVEWPDRRRGNEGCDLDIAIPDASSVDLKSSNGKLTVIGLAGDAKLRTSNGKVVLQNFAGNLSAKTSNGSVESTNVSGSQKIETSNGSVTMSGVMKKTEVDTSNGSIKLSFAESSAAPFDLSTSNGSVTVEVNQHFQGKLSLRTSNGSIRHNTKATILEDGKKKKVLQFGDSDQYSKVKTSNGKITVKSAIAN